MEDREEYLFNNLPFADEDDLDYCSSYCGELDRFRDMILDLEQQLFATQEKVDMLYQVNRAYRKALGL